jgi:hypothetical protein
MAGLVHDRTKEAAGFGLRSNLTDAFHAALLQDVDGRDIGER